MRDEAALSADFVIRILLAFLEFHCRCVYRRRNPGSVKMVAVFSTAATARIVSRIRIDAMHE